MLRNWYAVYTKPLKEKIVSAIFEKKGLEYFCPTINSNKAKSNNRKTFIEPLLMSYVFVYISESDISSVTSTPGVINILYWKSKPAIIKPEEIDAMKYLTTNFVNIKLIRSAVSFNESIKMKDDPTFIFNENMVSVKYQTIRVNLPSLGFTMIAERRAEEKGPVYEESSLLKTFPKRINSFFFN